MPPNDSPVAITARGDGVRVTIHAQPRASTSEIAGIHGDAIKVRLAAPPVDDAANEALVALFAQLLHRPRSTIRLVSGGTARRKVLEIDRCGVDDVLALLPR